MSVTEPELVPLKVRWNVWTDQEAHRNWMGSRHAATWFWAASGPRGHMTGAEATSKVAVERATVAAAMLESSHEREQAAVQ